MSMKFFTGLQDLLGLYEPGSTTSSPASPIPPTSSSMYSPMPQQTHSSANSVRKKVSDANRETTGERIRHCSHDRTVKFPDEDRMVTGYHEAPTSVFHAGVVGGTVDPAEIIQAYRAACQRRKCPPSFSIEKQIGYFHKSPNDRQEILCLKGERVSHAQMEALEEIFKRVQFNTIDFEYTFLDDDSAMSLGEMIEYYDSCVRLNLSFNKQIEQRGWTSIFRATKNCTSLQVLNLRYTTLCEKNIPLLCRTLRTTPTCSLTCLHLENTQLAGKNLLILICALKNNTGLKELYLGDNGLQTTDGSHIYQLITSNTSIQLLDLRNNCLSDAGVRHISDALRNRDALERSSLSAIVLWNNNVTGASMDCLAEALKENTKIETLNVGSNKLGVNGISKLKPALVSNSHLHRLGLQNTGIDCQGAIILAECIADNTALLRVDIRDNPIALAGLLALHSAMKMNKSITLLNIDSNCMKMNSDKVREYQAEFEQYFNEMQLYCDRNKEEVMSRLTVTFDDEDELKMSNVGNFEQKGNDENGKENEGSQQGTSNEEPQCSNDYTQVDGEQSMDDSKLENVTSKQNINNNNNNDDKKILSRACLAARREKHQRFTRSSSLTCTETVHDIHDRLREMSGSTHSLDTATTSAMPLDSTSNVESMKTIKKKTFIVSQPSAQISLSEWGSLPAIPQASPTAAPVVRKLRRFSVSPSSSVFDVTTSPTPPEMAKKITVDSIPENCANTGQAATTPQHCRPTTLAIGIPTFGSVPSGPSSAPVVICDAADIWSPTKKPEPISSPAPTFEIVNVWNAGSTPKVGHKVETDEKVEEACRFVVNDLLNYVEYEENSQVERKASILLRNAFSPPNVEEFLSSVTATPGNDQIKNQPVMVRSENVSSLKTPTTPSRMFEIVEELGEESDEIIVQQVVRGLVRDVLQSEKDQLRSTLERRRRHQVSARNSPV